MKKNKLGLNKKNSINCSLFLLALLMTQTNIIFPIRLFIWVLFGFVAFQRVDTTFFYLTLTQIVPEISNIPGNLATWAIATWVIYRLFSKRKFNFNIFSPIIITFFPLMIWLLLVSIIKNEISTYSFELCKGIIYCIIAFDSLQDRQINIKDVCIGIITACTFISLSFWLGDKSYLNNGIGFDNGYRGYARINGWRGNANYVMVMLCFAVIGMIHFWLQNQITSVKIPVSKNIFALIIIILSIPPLLSTQSRTLYIVTPIMILIIFLIEFPGIINKKKLVELLLQFSVLLLILLITVSIYLPSWKSRIQGVFLYQQSSGNFLSGRNYVWSLGVKSIIEAPLMGTGEKILGKSTTSHNTILDFGIIGGIPGIVLYIVFILSPIAFAKNNFKHANCRLLLIMYLTGIMISMSIGMQGSKIVYMLWALLFSYNQKFLLNTPKMFIQTKFSRNN